MFVKNEQDADALFFYQHQQRRAMHNQEFEEEENLMPDLHTAEHAPIAHSFSRNPEFRPRSQLRGCGGIPFW